MSELEKISELAKAKGLDLVTQVNAVVQAGYIGVDELMDVAGTYFDLCELIEKKLQGQPITVIGVISDVLPGLLPAILGAEVIPAEASDLQDDEIASLVAVGDNAQLGNNAPKYKQVLKMLLFGIQTVFVFKRV